MFYLVAFPRYDKGMLIIVHKSNSYKEVETRLKGSRVGDIYVNYAIVSDIYPLHFANDIAVTQQEWDSRLELSK